MMRYCARRSWSEIRRNATWDSEPITSSTEFVYAMGALWNWLKIEFDCFWRRGGIWKFNIKIIKTENSSSGELFCYHRIWIWWYVCGANKTCNSNCSTRNALTKRLEFFRETTHTKTKESIWYAKVFFLVSEIEILWNWHRKKNVNFKTNLDEKLWENLKKKNQRRSGNCA